MTRPTRRALLAAAGAALFAGCESEREPTISSTRSPAPAPTYTETPEGPSLTASLPGASLPSAPASERTVTMGCDNEDKVYFFSPALVWVEPGATIRWGLASQCRQQSLAYHPDNDRPLRMPADAEPWASPVMQGSGTFSHELTVPGVYDVAGLFEDAGQVSTVVVGRPTLADEPAMTDDGSALPAPARESFETLHRAVRAGFE